MNNQVEVRLPYLVSSEGGSHFVEYRCFNDKTNKLERFRVYKGFASKKTNEAVRKHAETLISELTDKLKNGWRPWDTRIMFAYNDYTDYFEATKLTGNQRKDKNHIRKYFSEFLEFKKADVRPKTFANYQSKLRNFRAWLDKTDQQNLIISEITQEVVKQFFLHLINERKLDKRTVSKYKQTLFIMFRYFVDMKMLNENPVHHLPRAMKLVDMAARPMTDEHVREYLLYVQEHDPQLMLASMFQLLLLCRPNRELRLMKCADVNLTKKIAYIRDETAKTSKRVVLMPDALVEIAQKWKLESYPGTYYIFGRGGKPGPDVVGMNYFNRKFSAIKKKLEMPDAYKFYSFKHTGAGKLMESGATLAELMSQLGHKRFESTIKYVHRHYGERSKKITDFNPSFLDGLDL
jgi:integrase